MENQKLITSYFRKMKGGEKSPKLTSLSNVFWSFVGAFAGIAALHYSLFDNFTATDINMIIGSFGASAVLVYGAIESPLAQPRNLIGGHILSALVGVFCYQLLPTQLWLSAALAVAAAIALMHLTKTLHPPGGATALIAVIGSPQLHDIGYLYALLPVARGAFILLIVALLVNNIPKARKYPQFWW
jgi:CBS-domain-containing membrane protein